MEYRVSEEEHGLSLLSFIKKRMEELSLKKIKRGIEEKRCLVNNKTELFPSRKLSEGDLVVFSSPSLESSIEKKVEILFQDPYFAIVNKPAGLISLDPFFQKALGEEGRTWKLVHRLDKDTSGLVLLAKTKEAQEQGEALFKGREVQKLYLALVDGKVEKPKGMIENFLGKKGAYQGQTLYGSVEEKQGKKAVTEWKKERSSQKASLLLCSPKTGRTHQIRVHLSEMGYPIIGDSQYARGPSSSGIRPARHLLHAWKLSFLHPITKKQISVEAPLPADFKEALTVLF